MRDIVENKIIEFQRSHRNRHVRRWVLSALMCVTALLTAYVLILPAVTMEAETVCGKVRHRHSDECYDAEGNLVCLLEEHEHDLPCFAQPVSNEPDYVCGYFYEHEHTDACYFPDGSLSCTLLEHEHTDACISAPSFAEIEDTGAESEPDGHSMTFRLMAAPGFSMMPDGDYYSSDLSEFLSNAELTDVDGNPVDLNDENATINVGENYHLFLHFDENPDTDNLKQFQYNSDGYLVYDLDDTGLKFDSTRSIGGDITILCDGSPRVVGRYIFELDPATGRHLTKVQFYDVDDRGEPTPGVNFIDHVQDAGFGVQVAVTVDSDEEDDELNLNLGASWNVTLKKNRDALLTVDKVEDGNNVPYENRYPKYDDATGTMLYKVIVKCTQGAVDNIRYQDSGTIKVLDVEYALTDSDYSNYSNFVITDLDGNSVASGDSFECLSAASGPISKGEGYVIYYRMKIDPPGREDVLKQAAAIYATVDNTITVDYQNPSDRDERCEPVEDSTSTRVPVTNLSKEGVSNGGTDAFGKKIINWIIVAGGKDGGLTTPFTVQDTIGPGHSFYADNPPTWELIDSDNQVMESGTFTSENFSQSGNMLSFSLPDNTEYRFRVKYSTVTDNDNGGSYLNKAEVLDKNWVATAQVNVAGGIGSMTKEVTDSDSDYLYFRITANIPHSIEPFQFLFTDNLFSGGEDTKIENAAEEVTVQVEYANEDGSRVVYDIPAYDTDAEYGSEDHDVRFYINKDSAPVPEKLFTWQMLFFKGVTDQIHHTRSYWYYNDHDCILTVNYKIPKSAAVFFNDGTTTTLREHLSAGNIITNKAFFSQYDASANYTEPLPVTKRGRVEDFSTGTLLYEVAFTNDVIPVGETNPANYLPLCNNFVNAHFTDEFDERLEYVSDSLMAFVYKRSDNNQWSYYGSNFGINASNPGQSPNIQAIFRYNGPNPSGSTIDALWDDFVYEKHATSGTEDIFGHFYRAWMVNSSVSEGMSLEEFANLLRKDNGDNDTAVVFLYQLRVKDEYKLDAQMKLQNEAGVNWKMPDGGTYVSPPAIFDIDYDSALVKKEMNYQDGDTVSYEIILNPHGIDLTPNETMTVKDEMCELLSLYAASLKVYRGTPGTPEPVWGDEIDPRALYDPVKNTITWILPDDVPLKITYNCLVLGAEEGSSVSLDNSVSINGTPDSVSANHANVTITASSSTGIGKNHYMYLQKQDEGNNPLNGAVFALYGNKETHGVPAPDGVKQTIVCEGVTLYYYSSHKTQDDPENPYLHGVFRLDEESDNLEAKGLFALVEVEAPSGFDVNPDPMYFYWLQRPEDAIEGVEVFVDEKDYAFVDSPLSYVLPETGSSGGLICMGLAVTCFTAAAVLLIDKIRRSRCGERR